MRQRFLQTAAAPWRESRARTHADGDRGAKRAEIHASDLLDFTRGPENRNQFFKKFHKFVQSCFFEPTIMEEIDVSHLATGLGNESTLVEALVVTNACFPESLFALACMPCLQPEQDCTGANWQ